MKNGIWNIHLRLKDTTESIAEVVIGSVSVDTSPPSGTLLINDDAQFINTPEVALSLSGNDPLSGLARNEFFKRRDKLVRLGAFPSTRIGS